MMSIKIKTFARVLGFELRPWGRSPIEGPPTSLTNLETLITSCLGAWLELVVKTDTRTKQKEERGVR